MKTLLLLLSMYFFLSSTVYAKAEYALDDFTNAAISANMPVFELFLAENAVIYLDNREKKLTKDSFLTIKKANFERRGWPYRLTDREISKTAHKDIFLFKQTLKNTEKVLEISGVLVEKNYMWKIVELDISLSIDDLFYLPGTNLTKEAISTDDK